MVDQTNETKDPTEGYSRALQSIGLPEALAEPQERMLRGYRSAAQTAAEEKAKRESAGLQAEAGAIQRFGAQQKEAARAFEIMPARPKDTITKDTEEGMMGLAALLPIAGMMLGAKGQMSGINAMNAMAGVIKGYSEGNQQRIDFERKKYENALKEWETNYQLIKDGFERAIKMAATDRDGAIAVAKATAAKVGSAELSAMVDKETLPTILDRINKVGEEYMKNKNRFVSTKLVQVQTPEGPKLVTQEEATAAARSGQPMTPAARASERPLMPSAAERKNYVGLNQMAETADELIKKLQDPEFAKKVDKYRLSAFLSEEGGKAASQLLSKKVEPDVQDFINKATRLRNQYYLEISGKAVTGGEAMRNYNVVPQPGDSAERLRQKLGSLSEGARGDVNQFRQMYPKLPELTRGGKVVTTMPDQSAPAAGAKTYEVGDVIESGGKRYRAITRGPDPDVEEIQ